MENGGRRQAGGAAASAAFQLSEAWRALRWKRCAMTNNSSSDQSINNPTRAQGSTIPKKKIGSAWCAIGSTKATPMTAKTSAKAEPVATIPMCSASPHSGQEESGGVERRSYRQRRQRMGVVGSGKRRSAPWFDLTHRRSGRPLRGLYRNRGGWIQSDIGHGGNSVCPLTSL